MWTRRAVPTLGLNPRVAQFMSRWYTLSLAFFVSRLGLTNHDGEGWVERITGSLRGRSHLLSVVEPAPATVGKLHALWVWSSRVDNSRRTMHTVKPRASASTSMGISNEMSSSQGNKRCPLTNNEIHRAQCIYLVYRWNMVIQQALPCYLACRDMSSFTCIPSPIRATAN